ncbi:MAG TPA: insulinase family protein [Chlamydiales bacterium]|nr:insulinase family protein [Chlamydiales bacterium]
MIPEAITEEIVLEEIPDAAALPFLNPDLKERKTAKLRLQNGLEILLISDPGIDQSSASMAVRSGSWKDPEEYPGMAHFCEHMLFMGSKKYPDSSDFMNRIADAGGHTNAFTAPHRTVYMFSCKHTQFLDNLDRFSRFFIDPLFDPSQISRELHAVDQEFAKNLEHDRWREMMIFKEMGNPRHPNRKFSSGNSETLKGIPPEALHSWHKENYSAEKMHLFLCSNLPLSDLKREATAMFSLVPISEKAQPSSDSWIEMTSSKQRGHIAYIKPIQKRQLLLLMWELPLPLADDATKSANLVAYALNRGQPYSLYERLKQEGLIDSISIRVDDLGGKEHRFFFVYFELTSKGMSAIDTTVLRFFEAVQGLRASSLPLYLFQEKNNISQLSYQYQTQQDAFQIAEWMGDSLPDEELSTFPRGQILAAAYSPEKIGQALDLLIPETCCVSLTAPPALSGVEPDRKERWFGAEYAVRPLPAEWMSRWKAAKPNPDIHLATSNPFLPSKFDLAPANGSSIPVLLSETESGIAYYSRAPEFSAPEAVIHVHIRSSQLVPTARSSVLTSLYLDHLTDVLHPTLAAASSAGLSTKLELEKLKIHLQVSGFNDKAPLLLEQILRQMPLHPPTKEQFEIYMARHEKAYSNTEKALPLSQAKDLLESLLINERTSGAEKLAALQSISYEDFLQFHSKLFDKTYTEALFAGNLTLKEAQSSWIDIQHILSKGTYPKAQHTQSKVLELPAQSGPFAVFRSTAALGNGTILAIDAGEFTFQGRAAQEILGNALREAFFNELRTKQKTAYIAKAEPAEIEDRLFHLFMVQSNSHHPEDLLYRFELFLEEFLEAKSVSAERFETLKATSIHSLKTRFRNLKDKALLWNLLAFEKRADFNYIEKRIAALKDLSYEQFLEYTKEALHRANLRRLAVLFEGKLPSFSYQSVEPNRLLEVSRYIPKPTQKI